MCTSSARRRGFTLLEVMVVVAIVGIGAAIAVPGFYSSFKRQAVRNEARQFISSLREARGLAISRTAVPGLVCPGGGGGGSGSGSGSGGGAAVPCLPRTVGVRVISRTAYEVFADADAQDGGEVVVQTIDLATRGGDNRVEIDQPDIPFAIRFAPNGTLTGRDSNGRAMLIRDMHTQEVHTLSITAAGFATLADPGS